MNVHKNARLTTHVTRHVGSVALMKPAPVTV